MLPTIENVPELSTSTDFSFAPHPLDTPTTPSGGSVPVDELLTTAIPLNTNAHNNNGNYNNNNNHSNNNNNNTTNNIKNEGNVSFVFNNCTNVTINHVPPACKKRKIAEVSENQITSIEQEMRAMKAKLNFIVAHLENIVGGLQQENGNTFQVPTGLLRDFFDQSVPPFYFTPVTTPNFPEQPSPSEDE